MKSTLFLLVVLVLCGSSYVIAQDSSLVVTLPADNITSTSARLRALLTTDGSETFVGFSLFVENDQGSQGAPPEVRVSGQAGIVEVSLTITGLVPNTRYMFWPGINQKNIGERETFETEAGPRGERLIIPLNLWDTRNMVRTMYFGVDTYGSKCLDFSLGEHEEPPNPPSVIYAMAQFKGDCLGNGTLINLHRYIGTAQVDTYKVEFLADIAAYPVSISWPNLDSLYSGPVVLRIGSETIDMKSTNRYDINDDEFTVFRIFAKGPRPENNRTKVITRVINDWGDSWCRFKSCVFPSSDTTKVWFEWGSTPALGNITPPQTLICRAPVLDFSQTIGGIESATRYYYRGVTEDQTGINFGATQSFGNGTPLHVPIVRSGPDKYSLEQNYPNPFNPMTTIRYTLPEKVHVTVSVFNMLGQVVALLVDGVQDPGVKSVSFNATGLPSGVYLSKIMAGTFTDTKMLLLVK